MFNQTRRFARKILPSAVLAMLALASACQNLIAPRECRLATDTSAVMGRNNQGKYDTLAVVIYQKDKCK